MKKILLILAAVIIIGIGGYFISKKSYPAPASSPALQPIQQNQEQLSKESKVNIENFAFTPADLTVKAGEKITWKNNDSAPHQIKSAAFNSGLLSKGESFSFTFNNTGTFNYLCSIHPLMIGKIIVE